MTTVYQAIARFKAAAAQLPVNGRPDLTMRPLTAPDVTPQYVDGLNDPVVHQFLIGPRTTRQTTETVRAYVEANGAAEDSILFGIFREGALRGTIRLHDVAHDGSEALVGLALFDKSVWGLGIGAACLRKVVEISSEIGIASLRGGIEVANTRSSTCFAKVGFRLVETKMREGIGNVAVWAIACPRSS